jgi:endo-1,4-beta-xylanase
MVALSYLGLALSTLASSFAAPTEPAETPVQKRDAYNFVMGTDHPLTLARRNSTVSRRTTNYNQDYTTGGSVYFAPASGEFYASWDTTDDFVIGVGWNPGSTLYGPRHTFSLFLSSLPLDQICLPRTVPRPITHGGSFTVSSGLASLSVYGWTTNPLVEYYIMEDTVDLSQSGTQKGTVSSDGATYTIWENERVNEPSILGTSTFNQYISVRESGTASGTVTVENHFNAWRNLGMDLGTLNFQVIAVESWDGSGTCYQAISN